MKTPDAIDNSIAAWKEFSKGIDILEIQAAFERVVYNAILVERERCAQIAEGFIPSGFSGGIGVARDDRARTIAAAIRNKQ